MNDEFLSTDEANPLFQRNLKIIEMIEEGLSYAEIGRRLNLTRARVSQIALDNGYVVRPSLVSDKRKKVIMDDEACIQVDETSATK